MKANRSRKKLINAAKRLTAFTAAVLAAAMCAASAFAVEGEDYPADPEYTEAQVQTEYVEPETEYVEPETEYVEPETEYVEPTTEYVAPETEYVEPTTEYVEPTTEPVAQEETVWQQQYEETVATEAQSTTAFQAPTIAKTVSDKKYTTNYTAGVLSWICVGVGVLTVIIVMASTKLGARKM